MHEVGIMQSALEIALVRAEEQGATRIHRIGLRVGALSGVVPEALEFAFEVLKQDTLAAGADLEVEYVPLRVYCPKCKQEFAPDGFWYACPDCGETQTEVRRGQELDVMRVELSGEENEIETGSGALDG